MAIFRATREEEQAYRDNPALNQSLLKILEKGPEFFLAKAKTPEELELEEYERDRKQFILGSGAERLTTYGSERVKEDYYISEMEKFPSDTIVAILNMTYSLCEGALLTDDSRFRRHLITAMDKYGYYMNRVKPDWKDDNRYSTLLKEGEAYWKLLCESGGRECISQQEKNVMEEVAKSWLRNTPTAQAFEENEEVDIYYQLPIYFKCADEDCKALLDMVRVDHRQRVIYPFDLKTMAGLTRTFLQNGFRRYRYDIQAAFYLEALMHWMDHFYPLFDGYTIAPFTFIVESTTPNLIGVPLLYECEPDVIQAGKFGIPERTRVTIVEGWSHFKRQVTIPTPPKPGFLKLIEDYKWYKENGFRAHRDIVQKQGIIPIKLTDLL